MEMEILIEERLRFWCGRIDLPAGAVEELAAVARRVHTEPPLGELFAAEVEKNVVRGEWFNQWSPMPFDAAVEAALGERTGLFYLLTYLAALPAAEREYVRRGINLDIFRDTMGDIRTWLVHEYDLFGVWTFRQFMWIHLHLSCQLFRLGRMQFMLKAFEGGVRAFRRRVGGEVVLLAGENMLLRPDGSALGAGRVRPEDPFYRGSTFVLDESWSPHYEETQASWSGNQVSPYGTAQKERVFLPKTEWELILQPGDTVLDLHIPRKDPFTPQACRDSLRRAFEFFRVQAPERPFKAAYCHTWFFTPQLQQILPPESNIVRFQREFYLYPYSGGPGFLWSYVFGEKVTSLAGAPRDTSIRRAVLDWIDAGGELFDLAGLMFHGPDEWGSQPYMSRWDKTDDRKLS